MYIILYGTANCKMASLAGGAVFTVCRILVLIISLLCQTVTSIWQSTAWYPAYCAGLVSTTYSCIVIQIYGLKGV
jgi:hypothetical protein